MQLGTDTHELLEEYYNTGKPPIMDETVDDQVKIMVNGYYEWLATTGSDDYYNVIGVEEVMTATINDIPFRGICDLRVEDKDTGSHFLIDHKTGADFRLESYSRFNPQIRLYHAISWVGEGKTVAGTYLNMIKRSKQTSRAKPPFYKRDFTPLIEDIVKVDIERFTYWGNQILEARELETPPPAKLSQSCSYCPYQEPCFKQDLGGNYEQILESAFKKEDPNERYNT